MEVKIYQPMTQKVSLHHRNDRVAPWMLTPDVLAELSRGHDSVHRAIDDIYNRFARPLPHYNPFQILGLYICLGLFFLIHPADSFLNPP